MSILICFSLSTFRYRDPCSESLNEDDDHTITLVGNANRRAVTLAKTCEQGNELRDCRAPRDWSILALQNTRTGKSHYLVICKCPNTYKLGKVDSSFEVTKWLNKSFQRVHCRMISRLMLVYLESMFTECSACLNHRASESGNLDQSYIRPTAQRTQQSRQQLMIIAAASKFDWFQLNNRQPPHTIHIQYFNIFPIWFSSNDITR